MMRKRSDRGLDFFLSIGQCKILHHFQLPISFNHQFFERADWEKVWAAFLLQIVNEYFNGKEGRIRGPGPRTPTKRGAST